MADSPKSDLSRSRFSTPVQELDDHRFHVESLPRADIIASGHARRGTAGSVVADRSGLLPVTESLHHGSISRDFENAIIDDDRNGVDEARGRQGSVSPRIARSSTLRRTLNQAENRNRSRNSSKSSRSISPPNSVHAFAERRARGRAGTVASYVPSFIGSAHRTVSGGTHRRRPTFGEYNPKGDGDVDSLSQGSVADDVCFPQIDEPTKPYTIDFDDLNEFVARQRERSPEHPRRRKQSFSCQSHQAKVSHDLRPQNSAHKVPKSVTDAPSSVRSSSEKVRDRLTQDLDEKLSNLEAPPNQTDRRTFQPEPVNRWSFFSSDLEESIHAPELGDLLMPGETFQHLFQLAPEGGVWWLDMLMPSEEEVEVVCKAFGIHGLTREDIAKQETREKVELFKSYYFVCFRSFYQMDKSSENYMHPVNVYAVVFREGILTFTFSPSPHAANVRKRMGKLRDYVKLGSDWICYALIDDIVDSFDPIIRSVEYETDVIEDTVFTARLEDSRLVLRQIGDCRKKVMSLIRLLGGKADVVKGFAKRCTEQYSIAPRQDVGMYLSDIQDHVVTMMSNLGFFEKMLSRSHSNYLAQISLDQTKQGAKANRVLGKVTFIATVLVPMNLVCGLFGMNVPVPGRETTGLQWFFGILGMLLLFVCIATVLAKRARLL